MDYDDFLWFLDREKERIKYKGNEVAQVELEGLLVSHPEVGETGVCAAWNEDEQAEVSHTVRMFRY